MGACGEGDWKKDRTSSTWYNERLDFQQNIPNFMEVRAFF